MKKYSAYKDSGIEWIGEIPEHWEIKEIKHGSYVKGRIGWKGLKSDEFLTDGYAFLVTGTDFRNGIINWHSCYHIDKKRYEEDQYIQLQEGDLLITKDGTIGKVALVINLRGNACLNSGIFLVRPLNQLYITEYLYWILNSNVFTEFINYRKTGSTISHLYQNVFVEFNFPVPNGKEQTALANFLDHKTRQIDELITKKERLIELLKEERTAIINRAVTKGLDPKVPMKDSGIEWLGEIPEHWEVNRLKRICKIQGRIGFKGYKKDDLVSTGEGALTLGAKHINKSNKIDLSEPEFIRWEKYYESPEIMIQTGDILVTQRGTLGKVAIVEKELGEATINPSMVLLKKIAINRKYLFYFINSKYFNANVEIISSSTAVPMISQEELGNFFVLVPKISEQEGIANYLNESLDIIDEQINNVQKEITLIKEYKTALINETVTGKIDVSDYKINHVTI